MMRKDFTMLKCILLLLSEYYYEIAVSHQNEIQEKMKNHGAHVALRKLPACAGEIEMESESVKGILDGFYRGETIVIADLPETVNGLLKAGWYVVILYHERNRNQLFGAARYAVEDVFSLEYRSYEEAFKRLAGLPWDILETDRLKVRESTVEDVDDFYRIYKEPSITLYMEDLYQEKEAEHAYMKAYIDQIYGFYGYGLWTVILKKTGQVIGRAGLSIREGYDLPELGFVIDAAYQNQGYGFEVCKGILAYAKTELAFDMVQALTDARNMISKHLLEKLGFVFREDVSVRDRVYQLFTVKI